MYYYKAKIQYDGTNYAGFQWQNGLLTIQSEFNKSLSQIIPGKFTTMAASRTDTGVHALEQFVKISSTQSMDCTSLLESLNFVLPNDIRCIYIEPSTGLFRPASDTTSKEYRYLFTNRVQSPKEDRRFIANISNKLDLKAMQTCIDLIHGAHDFCNFYSSGSNVKSTTRTISTCELSIIDPRLFFLKNELFNIPQDLDSCYELRIIADGFLKQMIRHLVSALWKVGSGKISPSEFLAYLDGPKSKKQLWKVAPPSGLFLYQINFMKSQEQKTHHSNF